MPVGRDDAHRLDEVVDVGVDAGVVAAGAGGQPAAEGRELEGLREVAQRVAVRPELVLEHRAEGAGLDARGPRDRIDLEHPVEAAEVDRDDAGEPVADGALDAADDRRAAAVGDRGDAGDEHQSSRATTSASVGGKATTSGGRGARRGRRARCRGTTCRRCARPGRVGRSSTSRRRPPARPRAARAGRGRRAGRVDRLDVPSEALGEAPGRRQHLVAADCLVLVAPSPPGAGASRRRGPHPGSLAAQEPSR